jgi:biopolymer transport protein ExbB
MLETLIKGGLLMIPLAICSVVGLSVLLERWMIFRANARIDVPSLRAKVGHLLAEDRLDEATTLCASTPGPVSATLLTGLQTLRKARELQVDFAVQRAVVEKAMEDYTPHAIHVMELRLNWLATISNVAPLFGMTGTVTGMIRSFGSLGGAGSLDAGLVGAGISEALVATASGLIIALASLIPYNGFMNRVAAVNLEIGEAAAELVQAMVLRHGRRLPAASSRA